MATLSAPTLSKLLTNVRNMLNQPFAANSFWSDYEITEYLNEAIRIYFSELTILNEGHYTTQTDLDIVSGQETVSLPTDFFEVRALYKKASNGYIICPYINNFIDSYSSPTSSDPNSFAPAYYFRDNSLVLRPIPNFSETAGLRLEYIRFPDTLVNGGDQLSTQVAPIFKQLIEMYAVYKAKLKESMVSGTDLTALASQNVATLYVLFRETINNRSKYPQYVSAFNPEGL